MWILLMIALSQPYEIKYIKVLGDYPNQYACVQEQKRALGIHEKGEYPTASFGCIKVKAFNRKGNYEMGKRKEFNL